MTEDEIKTYNNLRSDLIDAVSALIVIENNQRGYSPIVSATLDKILGTERHGPDKKIHEDHHDCVNVIPWPK